MSDITPEDRERLVDIRFGELLDRHLSKKFPEIFDQRLMEWAELASSNQPASGQPQRATPTRPLPPSEPPQERPRRRSAFDIAIAQAIGMS